MSIFALEHGLKQTNVANPGLSQEGLVQLDAYLNDELGSWLSGKKFGLVLIGRGRRFHETYAVFESVLKGAPVAEFIMLGSEDSRLDYQTNEPFEEVVPEEDTTTLITTAQRKVIPLEKSLRFDDPRFGQAAWAYPDAFAKSFPSPLLCICAKEFLKSLGATETGCGDLFNFHLANRLVVRIFRSGKRVSPRTAR